MRWLGMSNAHDPPVAMALWLLILAAAIGGGLSIPCGYSLAELLAPLGGLIVVLGSYFAARTLRENEVAQSTQMLAGGNEAVRIAGVHRLGAVAAETPRFRPFAQIALKAFAGEKANGKEARALARAVLSELDGLGKGEIADLQAGTPSGDQAGDEPKSAQT